MDYTDIQKRKEFNLIVACQKDDHYEVVKAIKQGAKKLNAAMDVAVSNKMRILLLNYGADRIISLFEYAVINDNFTFAKYLIERYKINQTRYNSVFLLACDIRLTSAVRSLYEYKEEWCNIEDGFNSITHGLNPDIELLNILLSHIFNQHDKYEHIHKKIHSRNVVYSFMGINDSYISLRKIRDRKQQELAAVINNIKIHDYDVNITHLIQDYVMFDYVE